MVVVQLRLCVNHARDWLAEGSRLGESLRRARRRWSRFGILHSENAGYFGRPAPAER